MEILEGFSLLSPRSALWERHKMEVRRQKTRKKLPFFREIEA
jgi:hypothetical protein